MSIRDGLTLSYECDIFNVRKYKEKLVNISDILKDIYEDQILALLSNYLD